MASPQFPLHENPDLVRACRLGDVRAVKERIEVRGESPNCIDELGDSALLLAVQAKNEALVRFLLEKGANPNIRDNVGWMPIHSACLRGELGSVALLLDHGAEVNALADGTSTALDISRFAEKDDVSKLLIVHGGKVREELIAEPEHDLLSIRHSPGHDHCTTYDPEFRNPNAWEPER